MSHGPTPKSARPKHKRQNKATDRTKNVTNYRVEASWDTRPDHPVIVRNPDRKHVYRKAREWADQGAYVIVQRHSGWDTWETLDEFDGPAIVAERQAAEQLAAAGYWPCPPGYNPDADDRQRTWLAWMQAKDEAEQRDAAEQERALAAERERRRRLDREAGTTARELMQQPPHVRERTVRHVTGAQR
ncbi:hypothetical protein ACWENS_05470 [Streptomyces sp. NPDC004532]